ncbi:LysM peptidoglycan-binding domain-containing protein [Devosia marina]|uniref:LysM peptidoglycan-binding domain-containing protein n=1 Tax=Devosia marina TaxID=2683198 RepID=A0A7X3K2L5_9HYPH|nr:LysM peptidoglycan-binding domain-containing protein [Devosia marina]MVS97669.1 LysM peptidoglycan-binding domain-containing protein [Devosia marina]
MNFYREGKLAETAPKRPLALTIGAAAVTLLVVLGVLSGPSIVTCFNSPEGMGQCLRGKMVEVGLIPAPPAPAVAETDAPAEEVVANVEEAVPAEPELDVTPALEAEADVDQVVAATFGLLRAEPDGSVVIAGSGTPGSRVEVFANGELLGTVEVGSSGDWVFVPDTPLPPGGLEITLGEEGKPGTAEDSFIVVIDEDKTSQPLVVASTPGEASEVLQGLTDPAQIAQAPVPAQKPATTEAPISAAAPETAGAGEPADVAEPAVESETAVAAPVEQADVSQPSTATESVPAVPAPESDADRSVDEPAMDVAALPEPAEPDASSAAEPPPATRESLPTQEAPATQAAAVAADAAEPAAATDSTEPAEPVVEPPVESEVATEDTVDAAETPVAATDEPVVDQTPAEEPAPVQTAVVVPPTIDAIELENDRTFFAGAGPDGGIIRLYVDDSFVADTTVEGGRWLVEAGPVLDSPSQRVRVDLLQPGSADVIARAEVDFVVDVPGADTPIDVAQAPAPESEPASAPETTAPPVPAPAADAPVEPAVVAPDVPAIEADVAVPEEGTPQPAETPEPVVAEPEQPSEAPDVQVAAGDQTKPVSAQPTTTPTAADAPASEELQQALAEPVESAVETVSDEPTVPTMVAVSLGDPDAQRFASGKAIIRRGDNLWTIARRVYGEGLKYTTIYQANTGQIRDPDRIYPGQVFDLPEEVPVQ